MVQFKVIIILCSSLIISLAIIPKNIWTFVPNQQQLSTLQTLCLNNIKKYAQQQEYGFHLLTNSNYVYALEDKQLIPNFLKHSQLDPQISRPAMIQLQVLKQKGGIWIDHSIMLVQNLSWIQTLKNQKFVNNRIDNFSVVLFYQPSWFDQTHKVTHPKTQDLVISPHYKPWFMAAQKGAAYIQNLLVFYKDVATKTYKQNVDSFSDAGYEVVDYLLDQQLFFEWAMRMTIQIQQKQLKKQNKLAVSEYSISGIDASKSALVVQEEAKSHIDLTCKYLAEVTIEELDITLHYLVRFDKEIAMQLYQTLEKDYVNLDRFHSAGDLYCDSKNIPLRYIVNGSVIEKYLFRPNNQDQIPVYDSDYIRHHCQGSYVEVYLLVFTKYLLPVIAVALNIFLLKKSINIFRPESGVLPRNVYKNGEEFVY